jgi:hypothetical protein
MKRAKPLKGGDAKPRVYSQEVMTAGLPKIVFDNAFGM